MWSAAHKCVAPHQSLRMLTSCWLFCNNVTNILHVFMLCVLMAVIWKNRWNKHNHTGMNVTVMARYQYYYYYSTEVQGCNVSNYSNYIVKVANTTEFWLKGWHTVLLLKLFPAGHSYVVFFFLAYANIGVVNSYISKSSLIPRPLPSFLLLSYHTVSNRKPGVGTSKQIHSWFARQGRPSLIIL